MEPLADLIQRIWKEELEKERRRRMSYPKDLEEYSDEQLEKELKRREVLRRAGWCSYCMNRISSDANPTNSCRYHEHLVGMSGTKITVKRLDPPDQN